VKYSRFEWLTIGVGAAAVLGTIGFSLRPSPDWIEIVAQLLLLGVLVCAVHWGRKGGMTAALGATIGYVLLRIPYITADPSATVFEILIIRAATFGIIGIAGGEICSRIKYFFARLEDACSIDEHSHVFNQRFLAQLIETQVAETRRYSTEFCVCTIALSPLLTSELRPARARALVRAVADHIRNDVRLIDDVGRLDDGRFVLVLPHTPKSGGDVATARVRRGVRDVLGAKDESVTATVLGSAEDLDAIQSMVDALRVPAAEPFSPIGQPAG
jgi:GGDEF domain-containing protein